MPINLVKRGALNIGFISTRIAGTDGVSLETAKWADVLERLGHTCFYFAGSCDRAEDRSLVIPDLFYRHPEIKGRHESFWGHSKRRPEDTVWIHAKRDYYRLEIRKFISTFEIDVLVPENVLAIPLNIPLGLAIAELIAETGIPTIAHHHDFTWERKRFLVNCVSDYISMAFPPNLLPIQHVVINSLAHHQLARRTGVGSTVIPNVMEFEKPAEKADEYSSDLRSVLGLDSDELFVLQPTRVIQRKGIEHAIEIVSRLGRKVALVISHAAGDEGTEYERRVRQYADLLGVRTLFISDIFGSKRGTTDDGRKIYSIGDVYPHADLVTYPSEFEGFGNAFLEAIYFRRPIVVNHYSTYAVDIRPKGFLVIEFDNYVTEDTISRIHRVIDNPSLVAEMTNENYRLALKHFSYATLERQLRVLLANCLGQTNL